MGKTYQSITINASVDSVWKAIRDFHDMSWCPNVVTKLDKIGDIPGDQIGAGRLLNDAFKETLKIVDNGQMTFSYSIDDGPSPICKDDVKDYVGTVKVSAADNGTLVEWTSTWEENDEAAYEFCHGIYLALLDDMKKSLE
jgi:hypothetical protein